MELNSFYKTELSPKDIFNSMQKNIFDFSPNLTSINSKYLNIRSILLNLLRQISTKMCFKSQTYFLSIYYLDILFTTNKNQKFDLNYNTLALACLLLSAKNCENDPIVPELKYFTKIYNKIIGNRNAISVSDLFYSEVMTIKLLNHKLNFYTIYDFNSFFFNNNILTEEQLKDIDNNFEPENNYSFYNNDNISLKIKKVYEKIYRLSRHYLDMLLVNSLSIKYSSLLLSIIIMKKSIEYILLEEKCKEYNGLDNITIEKFIIKTNNYFNRVIKGYYEYDYENVPEYQKLINEYDIIQLFNQNKNEYGKNHYSIKQSKTLTSFNKNNLKKYKNNNYYNNNNPNKNKNSNQVLNIKVNEINFSSSKPSFHKLNSSNNINSKLQNINVMSNYSGQNIPLISHNNKIQAKENEVLNQKNFCRKLGIDNCIKDKIEVKQKHSNLDLNNYFSENLNNIRKTYISVFSPNKVLNSDKKISNVIKRTKSKENENEKINNFNMENLDENYMEGNGRLTMYINNNINNKNINQFANKAKPYYKKVVQNYNSRLYTKNNNNINNINNINQITNKHNFDNININPEIQNNYLSTIKIENKNRSKFELKTDIKAENKNIAKFKYRDFNILNLNKDFKEKTSYSNNKDKKISRLFHINLNPKYYIEGSTPSNSLFLNKNTNEEKFSSTLYINSINLKKKKHESKTSKSINNFDKLLTNSRIHNGINLKNDHKLKNYLQLSDEFNEKNFSSNKLTSSSKIIGFPIMKMKKEKTCEKISKNKNKIYLTENALYGEENPNKINADINLNEFIKAKKIEVKKNKFDNELKSRYKKLKNENILNNQGIMSKNLDEHLFKKNTSTIVINNNININFGNKSISGYKDNKKFGQNSISSLLNKIPLCYKTEEN